MAKEKNLSPHSIDTAIKIKSLRLLSDCLNPYAVMVEVNDSDYGLLNNNELCDVDFKALGIPGSQFNAINLQLSLFRY